jgi:hypothetical protein
MLEMEPRGQLQLMSQPTLAVNLIMDEVEKQGYDGLVRNEGGREMGGGDWVTSYRRVFIWIVIFTWTLNPKRYNQNYTFQEFNINIMNANSFYCLSSVYLTRNYPPINPGYYKVFFK